MNTAVFERRLVTIAMSLPEDKRDAFLSEIMARRTSPIIALLLSYFFGIFGVDRFYLGHIFLGILKLITFGGLGIWWLVDLFLVSGIAVGKNLELAERLAAEAAGGTSSF